MEEEIQASGRRTKRALEEASAVPQPPETKRRTAGPQGWAHGADGESSRHMPVAGARAPERADLEIAASSSPRDQALLRKQVDPAAVELLPLAGELLLNSRQAQESCRDQQQQQQQVFCQEACKNFGKSIHQDPLGAGRITSVTSLAGGKDDAREDAQENRVAKNQDPLGAGRIGSVTSLAGGKDDAREDAQENRVAKNQDPLSAGRIGSVTSLAGGKDKARGDAQESTVAKNQHPQAAMASTDRKEDEQIIIGQSLMNKNEAKKVPASITNFGADLLTEIFKKMPHFDMPNLAFASKWFFQVTQTMIFRQELRRNCSAEQRAGLYLGAIIQKTPMTYMAVSEDLPRKLKNAAVSLSDFLYNERKNANDLTIWDSRGGRFLVTADKYHVNFRICDPFDEPCYIALPECPFTAQKEDVVSASLVPDARTRSFGVIVIAVQTSDRSYLTVKRYESKFRQWRECSTRSSFKIPKRSDLRAVSVLSGGCINILNPTKGIIRVDVCALEISQISLPLPRLFINATRRSHMICRKRDGTLCFASVQSQTWQVPGTKRSKVVIYAFDNVSWKWTLNSEWPFPAILTSSDFVGSNEDLGAVLIGNGWDVLISLDIETGIYSHRMTESGAESDVLCYTIEYPSISWFHFSEG